jgi:anthranilate synthase component 1
MCIQLQAFKQSFTQAKAENRKRATLVETVPMRDPFEVYQSVCEYPETVCIMESMTHEGTKGDFSYVCVGGYDYMTLDSKQGIIRLKERMRRDCPPAHATLPYVCGPIGFFSYELITLIEETVKSHSNDPFRLPLGKLCFFSNVIVFDHRKQEMHYVTNVRISGKTKAMAFQDGCQSLQEMKRMVSHKPDSKRKVPLIGPFESNMTQAEYHEMVLKGKEHVVAGDVFQVVLSQRFQASYESDFSEGPGLSLYAKLREINPSPFMFHMRFGTNMGGLTLLGASPEIAVHIENKQMKIRPIAGTRKRGTTPEEDERLTLELKNDPKELAEHRMLVDLARNDIGRYCKADSITVSELMRISTSL